MDHVGGIAPIRTKDRRIAAVSHLGIPFFGLCLPLVLAVADEGQPPFCKVHVRHALAVQFRVFLLALVSFGVDLRYPYNTITYPVGMAILAVTFGFEIPNVRRALAGNPPVRLSLRRLTARPTNRPA